MAMTEDRDTERREGRVFTRPVAAGVRIFNGSMVGVLASGFVAPASHAGVVAIVGVANEAADNRDGVDGEVRIPVWRGTFALAQTGTAITDADYGRAVTAADDGTVSLVSGTQLIAGVVRAVGDAGVWVEF